MGSKVHIMEDQGQEIRYLESTKEFKKNEEVYLIDHAWTFKYRECERTLRENDSLLNRMANMLKYSDK